jgi:hypothetical protein
MRTAFLIPAGDQWLLEIDGKMHSLRRALGVDAVVTLSKEEGLKHVDNFIEKQVPELMLVQ